MILLQITGEVHAVRKALQAISLQLLGIRGRESFPANRTGPSSQSQGQPHPRPEAFPSVTAPPLIPKFHEGGIHGRMRPSQEILTFRLLCHADRVGGIIGKGGTIIKTVQQDTGCEIKVMEGTSDSEDRVIVVSGPVVCFDSDFSGYYRFSYKYIFSIFLLKKILVIYV